MDWNLKPWLRAANPTTPPRAMIEAQRSARVGAFALAVGALQQVVFLILRPDRGVTEVAIALQMEAQDMPPIEAEMAGVVTDWVMIATTVVSVGFAILCLVLAVVQWRKMTWLIPALMLALLAYSLVSVVNGFALLGENAGQLYGPLAIVQWIIMLATGFLYAAAVRGGLMLSRLQRSF